MTRPITRPLTVRCLALQASLAMSALVGTGCHPKTVIVTSTSAAIGGTIAGVIHGPTAASLSDRNVSIVNVETGERFQTTTGLNGGYAMHVPPGTYRLEIQLRNRETLAEDHPTILVSANGATEKTVDVGP